MPRILDTPLNWNTIMRYIKTGDFDKFGRSKDVSLAYQEDKKRVNQIYASTRDMILVNHFGFNPVSTKNNMITVSIVQEDNKSLELCLNTFPYYVKEEITHKVLWSLEEINKDQIEDYLSKHLDKNIEYIFFRNP